LNDTKNQKALHTRREKIMPNIATTVTPNKHEIFFHESRYRLLYVNTISLEMSAFYEYLSLSVSMLSTMVLRCVTVSTNSRRRLVSSCQSARDFNSSTQTIQVSSQVWCPGQVDLVIIKTKMLRPRPRPRPIKQQQDYITEKNSLLQYTCLLSKK